MSMTAARIARHQRGSALAVKRLAAEQDEAARLLAEQDRADARAVKAFLKKHGKACPNFVLVYELELTDARVSSAAARIGAARNGYGFWTLNN